MQVAIDANSRVIDITADDVEWTVDGGRVEHVDENPFEHDPWDYVWPEGGEIRYVAPPPDPIPEASAVCALLAAMPRLGVEIPDGTAALMRPYVLPYDATREYAEGELAERYGRVCRKTASGWRELG